MAVPVKVDLDAQIASLDARLKGAMSRNLDLSRQSLRSLARALPSLDQLLAMPRRRFDEATSRLGRGLELNTLNKRRLFENASTTLKAIPGQLSREVTRTRERVSTLSVRTDNAIDARFAAHRASLNAQNRILDSLSYKNVLKRGYAVIRDGSDAVVSLATDIATGQNISIEFSDGKIDAVAGNSGPPPATAKKKSSPPETAKKSQQGSLF